MKNNAKAALVRPIGTTAYEGRERNIITRYYRHLVVAYATDDTNDEDKSEITIFKLPDCMSDKRYSGDL